MYDKRATLLIENRTKTVNIQHDSSMLVPVLKVNPGIKKYQKFSSSFFTFIQDEADNTEVELNFDHDEAYEDICVALNSGNTEIHIQSLLKAE